MEWSRAICELLVIPKDWKSVASLIFHRVSLLFSESFTGITVDSLLLSFHKVTIFSNSIFNKKAVINEKLKSALLLVKKNKCLHHIPFSQLCLSWRGMRAAENLAEVWKCVKCKAWMYPRVTLFAPLILPMSGWEFKTQEWLQWKAEVDIGFWSWKGEG